MLPNEASLVTLGKLTPPHSLGSWRIPQTRLVRPRRLAWFGHSGQVALTPSSCGKSPPSSSLRPTLCNWQAALERRHRRRDNRSREPHVRPGRPARLGSNPSGGPKRGRGSRSRLL